MISLVKLKPFYKVFGKNGCGCGLSVFFMSHVENKPGSHYFWLHIRSTNCKIASPLLQIGSRFLLGVWQGLYRSRWTGS
jgi:hypothetical protein